MARPSDRNALLTHETVKAFAPIASAAVASRDAAAIESASHISAALEALAQWRRDTTETSRRHAFGAASAAYAVASSRATGHGAVATRRALTAYAAGLLLATGAQNDAQAALHACTGAARMLLALARAA
ncbi:hypothetical protein BAJUN_01910 [Bajunvirus bajun]|uniref:Uncharacterized protein n=1 Tax=Brevundimonas phage vB_BgoS-Bajun TaxID=2948594 RepID=A0A9E7N7S1_9CAUD|nr:hypothetical protein BAJUN_01910 [Brevundimonas phage vB_BgoS-Bajun]